jgi:hypothetical protein
MERDVYLQNSYKSWHEHSTKLPSRTPKERNMPICWALLISFWTLKKRTPLPRDPPRALEKDMYHFMSPPPLSLIVAYKCTLSSGSPTWSLWRHPSLNNCFLHSPNKETPSKFLKGSLWRKIICLPSQWSLFINVFRSSRKRSPPTKWGKT